MSGAIFAIDQDRPSGESHGTPGVARDDLWLGRIIHLIPSSPSGVFSWLWELLDQPVGSTAVITDADTDHPSFTPDLYGSYRVRCMTDSGGAGNVAILVCLCRFAYSDGAPLRHGRATPAFGETEGEDNFGGQTRGYAAAFEAVEEDTRTRLEHLETTPNGHVIQDPSSTPMAAEPNLQFAGLFVSVADDPTNHKTVVTVLGDGSGHVVEDSAGTPMTQRPNLQFKGLYVSDEGAPYYRTIIESAPWFQVVRDQVDTSYQRQVLQFPNSILTDDPVNNRLKVSTFSAGGDLGGTPTSQRVDKVNGLPVCAASTAVLGYTVKVVEKQAWTAPQFIAFDGTDMWVLDTAGPDENLVRQVTPSGSTATLGRTIDLSSVVHSGPVHIDVDATYVYVLYSDSQRLYVVDKATGVIVGICAVAGATGASTSFCLEGGNIWVVINDFGTNIPHVDKFVTSAVLTAYPEPATSSTSYPTGVTGECQSIILATSYLWVTSNAAGIGTLVRMDPATGSTTSYTDAGSRPYYGLDYSVFTDIIGIATHNTQLVKIELGLWPTPGRTENDLSGYGVYSYGVCHDNNYFFISSSNNNNVIVVEQLDGLYTDIVTVSGDRLYEGVSVAYSASCWFCCKQVGSGMPGLRHIDLSSYTQVNLEKALGYEVTPTAFSAGGDLSGSATSQNVDKIKGVAVSATAPVAGKFLEYDGSDWAPQFLPSYKYTINACPVSTVENIGTPLVAGACYFDLSKLAGVTSATKKIYFRVIASASDVSKTTTVDLYDLNGITPGGVGQVSGSVLTTSAVTPTFLQVDLTSILGAVAAGILEVRVSLATPAIGYTGTVYTAYLEVEW